MSREVPVTPTTTPVIANEDGQPLKPGMEVWVRGHVGTARPHHPDDVLVVFEDTKASHWSIEFHREAVV